MVRAFLALAAAYGTASRTRCCTVAPSLRPGLFPRRLPALTSDVSSLVPYVPPHHTFRDHAGPVPSPRPPCPLVLSPSNASRKRKKNHLSLAQFSQRAREGGRGERERRARPPTNKMFKDQGKRGENAELQEELASNDKDKKRDAVKKVIRDMTLGKDVSGLFSAVVNNMMTPNLEVRKLVYLYLINYAKTQPELAIMAVNGFVKDARCAGRAPPASTHSRPECPSQSQMFRVVL